MTVIDAERDGKAVRILVDGAKLTFIYDDDLVELLDHGRSTVTRAGFVEPDHGGAGWVVLPSVSITKGRPGTLALGPFRTHAEAIKAERDFLRAEVGL